MRGKAQILGVILLLLGLGFNFSQVKAQTSRLDSVNLGEHCRFSQRDDAILIRNNAYGWRCADIVDGVVTEDYPLSVSDACSQQHPGSSALYLSYLDPNSWRCETIIQPAPQPKSPSSTCYSSTGVTIGTRARVIPEEQYPNKLRKGASLGSKRIGYLLPGSVFTILDGPVCADGYVWWQVRTSTRRVGWTAEGDTESDYIEPVD